MIRRTSEQQQTRKKTGILGGGGGGKGWDHVRNLKAKLFGMQGARSGHGFQGLHVEAEQAQAAPDVGGAAALTLTQNGGGRGRW